jgi:hypothetical protein
MIIVSEIQQLFIFIFVIDSGAVLLWIIELNSTTENEYPSKKKTENEYDRLLLSSWRTNILGTFSETENTVNIVF